LVGQNIDSLFNVSKKYKSEGKYDSAILILNELNTSSDLLPEDKSKVLNNLAINYIRKGDKKEGLRYYYDAISFNTSTKNLTELAKNYVNLATYYKSEDNLTLAIEYLSKAKTIKPDDRNITGNIELRLGDIYAIKSDSSQNAYDSAIYFYLSALSLFTQLNDSLRLAIIHNNLGYLYESNSNFSASIDNFKKAIQIAGRQDNYSSLALYSYNLANQYLKKKDYQLSLYHYNKALNLSKYRNPEFLMNLYSNMVKAKMAIGHVDEASVLFQKFNELRDSIYDTKKMQEVKDLETKYETELKDQEIANQQQTIAEKELQKNIYLIFSISLVILVFISVWFFLQRQKYLKKLKNEEIANMRTEQELKELNAMMHGQEEERNRIASDLHDRLGARLSSIKLLFQNGADEQENKQRVLSFIDEAIKETREISHNLSTDMLSRFGIKTALQDTMRSINESDKLEAELSIMGVEERWPLEIERNVYYVLLELINNTLKHAEATHIMVQLSQLDDEINVFYEDNGKGFKISQEEYKGMGMRSIQARMSAVKGRIFVNSKPGEGLNAVITIPLKESQKVDDSEKQKAKEV
jgi:signal transduction histidine kinase